MGCFSILAHRGSSGEAPENTLASFEKAIERGFDIELDLDLTRDGHLVVIHDGTVDRTTDGHGRVGDFTLEELKKLDAGVRFGLEFKNERIPAFHEVLNLVRGRVLIGIDFKDTLTGAEDKIVGALDHYKAVDRVFIFDQPPESSRRIKTLNPAIPVAARTNGAEPSEEFFNCTMKLFPEVELIWAVDPPKRGAVSGYYIASGMVDEAHRHGKRMYAVVVNDPLRWRELIAMGIDGICTDFPGALQRVVREKEETA
jgi:glycerophosphoryl diester phosphodiesterase